MERLKRMLSLPILNLIPSHPQSHAFPSSASILPILNLILFNPQPHPFPSSASSLPILSLIPFHLKHHPFPSSTNPFSSSALSIFNLILSHSQPHPFLPLPHYFHPWAENLLKICALLSSCFLSLFIYTMTLQEMLLYVKLRISCCKWRKSRGGNEMGL